MASRESHYRALSTRLLKEQFSPQLKHLIKQTDGINQSELARRLGYKSLSGLQALMNGKAQPKLHHLIGIALELKLHSLEELFGDFGTASAIVDEKSS